MKELPEIHQEHFEAWLFSQPDERVWSYRDAGGCMICEFFKETTNLSNPLVSERTYGRWEGKMETKTPLPKWIADFAKNETKWRAFDFFTAADAKAGYRKLFHESIEEPPVAVPRLARNIAILLALLLPLTASSQEPPKPALHADAGGCVVGGAILVGGTFVLWQLYKLCKRVFPDPTPPPDLSTNGIPSLGILAETDAASYLDQPLYSGCYVDCDAAGGPLTASSAPAPWTVVAIDVEIVDGAAVLKACRGTTTGRMVDVDEFGAALNKWGLPFDPNAPGQSYAHNGRPVSASQSRIKLDIGPHGTVPVISSVGPVYPVVIQRSPNFVSWEFLGEAQIPEGLTLRIVDTSLSGQMFYRVGVWR